MHDGQHGARASAGVGREQRGQLDAVEPERGRELRAETVGGVESELRLARETGSRRNLQRSRAKAVHERSRAVQLRADRSGCPETMRHDPAGTPSTRNNGEALSRCARPSQARECGGEPAEVAEPFRESVLDSLEGHAERILRRGCAHAREAIRLGLRELAPRRQLAVDLRDFELRLASVDLLRGCFEQECQIGMRQHLPTQADERRSGAQPVAPGVDGEVVPPSLEDDESGACSRPADRREPADQRVRCEVADPGDRSGGCRRRSSMRL